MPTTTSLAQLSQVDPTQIDPAELSNLEDVRLDSLESDEQALSRFLAQIRNPYCFLYHGTPIKLCFDAAGPSLDELLKEHLLQLQNDRL